MEGDGRRVVQDVPCTELEGVVSFGKFRQAVSRRAGCVAAEVVSEVVVQDIGLRQLAVDCQLHVVSDAVAGRVDAVLVGNLCEEVWRAVDFAAVRKGRCVEISVDGRTDGVVVDSL